MGEIVSTNQKTDLMEQATEFLLDVRATIDGKPLSTIPIAELGTLGTGMASLLPAFRKVTQTINVDSGGLYRLANQGKDGLLQYSPKNATYWAAYKNKSEMVQLIEAGPLSESENIVMPIDPATLMIAAALYSIEKQLNTIEEQGKQIYSFLEMEKESKVEANLEFLLSMISRYKYNWDNERVINANYKTATEIQHNSRENMLFYKKKVAEIINKKQLITVQSQVDSTLKKLLKMFKYYRLSVYTYSMASFVEVILSGNFKEDNVAAIKAEIEKVALEYRDIFTECSQYLEKITGIAVDKNIIKGAGAVVKAAGDVVGKIPIIKKAPADDLLKRSGRLLSDKANDFEENILKEFAGINNPGTRLFTERMADIITVCNHTETICFDKNNIYLVAEG